MFLPIILHGNGPLYITDFLPVSALGCKILKSFLVHKRYLFASFLKNELIHVFWFYLWLHAFMFWASFSSCHKLDPILQLAKLLCDFSILFILPLEKFPHNTMFYSTIGMTLWNISLQIYRLWDESWISLLSLLLPTFYLHSLLGPPSLTYSKFLLLSTLSGWKMLFW